MSEAMAFKELCTIHIMTLALIEAELHRIKEKRAHLSFVFMSTSVGRGTRAGGVSRVRIV